MFPRLAQIPKKLIDVRDRSCPPILRFPGFPLRVTCCEDLGAFAVARCGVSGWKEETEEEGEDPVGGIAFDRWWSRGLKRRVHGPESMCSNASRGFSQCAEKCGFFCVCTGGGVLASWYLPVTNEKIFRVSLWRYQEPRLPFL